MKTTPINDRLIQLTRYGFVNAYLVREDDGFTLVDTTMPRTGDALIAVATAAGAPIRRIALTHGHGDHVGSVGELKDKLGADVTTAVGVHRPAPVTADVLNALVSLGYSDKEATHAVKELPEGIAVADGIRHALKVLAKA